MINLFSMEVMALQHDDFGLKLTHIVERLRLDGTYSTKAIKESGLKELIFDRLKMNVDVHIVESPSINAAIIPPSLNSSHPFDQYFSGFHVADMGRLVAELGDRGHRIGKVDFDKVVLSGVLTKIPHPTYLTSGLLRSKLTDREVAAILLHELGHGMTYMYFLLNVTIASVITNAVVNAAFNKDGDREREVIFERGARILGLDNVQATGFRGQTKDQAKAALQALYIDHDITWLRSETGCNLYEAKSCEQLADQMVAKFGFGADLATALDKMFGNTRSGVFSNMVKIAAEAAIWLSVVGIVVMPVFLLTVDPGDLISPYDNPKDRIKYIRKHLIQELKNIDVVPKETQKKLLSDIDKIEKIAERHGPDESIMQYLQRRFLMPVREVKRLQDQQKDIEDLLYNDAFVAYAKFKQLT